MATDPQSLLDQARCLGCAGSSEYTLDLMEVALLAKWANKGGGGSGGGCVAPGVMTQNTAGFGQTTITLDYSTSAPAPTVGVIVKWGTVTGVYPNTKSFPVGTPYTLTAGDGITNGTTYFGVLIANSGSGCVSAPTAEWTGTTQFANATNDWSTRVQINGGAAPSFATLTAVNNYYNSLVAAGIDGLMITDCFFAPDNLIAAITPFFHVAGNDPWTNTGFVAGDLSVNGLTSAVGKFLNTGFNPAVSYASNNVAGFTVYELNSGSASMRMLSNDSVNYAGIYQDGTNVYTGSYNAWNLQAVDALGVTGGFSSANRTGAAAVAIYQARSTLPFQTTAANAGASQTRPNFPLFCFGWNNSGVAGLTGIIKGSYAGIHQGLTAVQAQALFNAVQALRVAFGGGFV
jgi:hypothetical protein